MEAKETGENKDATPSEAPSSPCTRRKTVVPLVNKENKPDVKPVGVAKENSPIAGAAKKKTPAAGVAKKKTPAAGVAKKKPPTAGGAKKNNPTTGVAKKNNPTAEVTKKNNPTAGVTKNNPQTAGGAKKNAQTAGKVKKNAVTAATGKTNTPAAVKGKKVQPIKKGKLEISGIKDVKVDQPKGEGSSGTPHEGNHTSLTPDFGGDLPEEHHSYSTKEADSVSLKGRKCQKKPKMETKESNEHGGEQVPPKVSEATPSDVKESKKESHDVSEAEERLVSNSLGALLAGFGNRQRQMNENNNSFSPPGSRFEKQSKNSPVPDGNSRRQPNKSDSFQIKEGADEFDSSFNTDKTNKEEGKVGRGRKNNNRFQDKEEGDKLVSAANTDKPKVGTMGQSIANKGNKSKEDENEEEMGKRKVSGSLGALLAGLGKRPFQAPEDQQPFASPGNRRKSAMNEQSSMKRPRDVKSEDAPKDGNSDNSSKENQLQERKGGTTNESKGGVNQGTSGEQESLGENEKRKMSGSIGALLAGLGKRQQQAYEDLQLTPPGNRRKSAMNEQSSMKSPRDSKSEDAPKDGNFDNSSKEDQLQEGKGGTTNESKDAVNKDTSGEQEGLGENEKIKMTGSIGALLAGLGKRQFQAPDDPQSFKSPGNRKQSMGKSVETGGAANENKGKSGVNQDTFDEKDGSEENVEVKRTQSLGSLLAGLGSRRQEFTSNDQQQFSLPGSRYDRDPYNNRGFDNRGRGSDRGFNNIRGRGSDRGFNNSRGHGNDRGFDNNRGRGSDMGFNNNRGRGNDMGFNNNRGRGNDRGFNNNRGRGNDRGFNNNRGRGNDRSRDYDNEWSKGSKKSGDHGSSDDERATSSEREESIVREEGNVIYVRGHKPKTKPSEKELENQKKSLEKNMSFEEEAEVRKTHCLGSILAGLANRTFPDPPPPPPKRDDDGRGGEKRGRSYDRDGDGGESSYRGRGSRKRSYDDEDEDANGYRNRRRYREREDGRGGDWDRNSDRGRRGFRDRSWEGESKSKKGKRDEPFDIEKATQEIKEAKEWVDKEYGDGVFSVGLSEDRKLSFVCEVCNVQLNKQSVTLHGDGMQHLKRHNVWEKRRKMAAKEEQEAKYVGGRVGWVKVEEEQKSATPAPKTPATVTDKSNRNSAYGYDNSHYGQDPYDYNNPYYMQQPPYGAMGYMGAGPMPDYMMGGSGPAPLSGAGVNKGTGNWGNAGQINTAIPPPPPPVTSGAPPPPSVMAVVPPPPPAVAVVPPPPPVVTAVPPPAKPKPNRGGATGSLLQRLDACAVTTEKDSDLAAGVISALLKSLKEFNHKRGDTKFIEVLTEIDIKFRSLKAHKSSALSAVASEANTASSNKYTSSAYGSSGASKYDPNVSKNAPPNSNTGTWYSQGRGSAPASSYSQGTGKSTALEAVASNYSSSGSANKISRNSSTYTSSGYASYGSGNSIPSLTSGYSSHAATKGTGPSATSYPQQGTKSTNYAAHGPSGASGSYSGHANYYSTSYPGQTTSSNKPPENNDYNSQGKVAAKDTGYYTQGTSSTETYQGYSSKTPGGSDVLEIIRSGNEPPPPPPPEGSSAQNYSAQGYQTNYPVGYYNMGAPPAQYNQQY